MSTTINTDVISKMCTKCKGIKRDTEFYKNKLTPDGLASQCKACSKKPTKGELRKDAMRKLLTATHILSQLSPGVDEDGEVSLGIQRANDLVAEAIDTLM